MSDTSQVARTVSPVLWKIAGSIFILAAAVKLIDQFWVLDTINWWAVGRAVVLFGGGLTMLLIQFGKREPSKS